MTEHAAVAVGMEPPPAVRDGTAAVPRTPLGSTQRHRARRTVVVLALVAVGFYLLSFVQIFLMK